MEPNADVIAQIIARASSPGYEAWWAKVAHAGYCSSPVELSGRDANGRPVKILTRCKNRRASVCPSCSALYSGDTWQLVHQGISPHDSELLDGGPTVFATLTAPGFGTVHTATQNSRPCRPGPRAMCPHGRSLQLLAGSRTRRGTTRRAALPGVLRLLQSRALHLARAAALAPLHRHPATPGQTARPDGLRVVREGRRAPASWRSALPRGDPPGQLGHALAGAGGTRAPGRGVGAARGARLRAANS